MKRTKEKKNYNEVDLEVVDEEQDGVDGEELEEYEGEPSDEEYSDEDYVEEEYEEYGEGFDEEEGGEEYVEYVDEPEKKNPYSGPLTILGMLLMLAVVALIGAHMYFKYWSPEAREAASGGKVDEEALQAAINEAVLAKEQEMQARLLEEYAQGLSVGEQQVLDMFRQNLEDGKSLVDTLRKMYADKLVVASGGQYHFVPINDKLAKNDYAMENLVVTGDGEIQYVQGGNVVSYKGIDVSKFQGTIDWPKVAADGVTFAYVRVGYRGYGEAGKLVEDPSARDNLKGANDAGIKTGVYFYTQAITEAEAKEEVNMLLGIIKPYRIDCPVVIDVERVANSSARMNKLDKKTRTKIVKAFCEAVKTGGYRPMIYCNLEMAAVMLDIAELEEYDKWFAFYTPEFYYPYAYRVWQYSDKGKVQGIAGDVDMNVAFEPLWK
ncbi:MAG: glycoside hydrolase family 25 protein [Lachnospiraceae bacterium]|nr:glycoside hydrolase family 25 protein [Lachnospiraceae bacterium]